MEEQILERINSINIGLSEHHGPLSITFDGSGAAREIASDFIDFVDWITGNDHWPVVWDGNGRWLIRQVPAIEGMKVRSTDDIYRFWYSEIKGRSPLK